MANTTTLTPEYIDCACVIHGNAYSWTYVENLYNMLNRHLTPDIRLHVYTESERPVPAPMIKHALTDWSIGRSRQAWWYKMQLFDPAHHAGPMLYFDLDTVIVQNIDWIWQQHSTSYFWAIRDFKYLWRAIDNGLNSSIMWWDTRNHKNIWESFAQQDLTAVMKKYPGDQDYISAMIPQNQRKFFDINRVQSWRWQCLDGGYDFRRRRYLTPGTGTCITPNTSVMVFHGNPKPDQVTEVLVRQHWC